MTSCFAKMAGRRIFVEKSSKVDQFLSNMFHRRRSWPFSKTLRSCWKKMRNGKLFFELLLSFLKFIFLLWSHPDIKIINWACVVFLMVDSIHTEGVGSKLISLTCPLASTIAYLYTHVSQTKMQLLNYLVKDGSSSICLSRFNLSCECIFSFPVLGPLILP